MSATAAADPPDGDSAEDHAYFQALESAFLKLRGAATLLAPADWHAAVAWRRLGVPLPLVERVMADLFEKRRAGRGGRRISSLRYFAPAVEAAWEEMRVLSAGGERPELAPEPLVVAERVERLADALPADLPRRDAWRARIAGLAAREAGEVEAVEQELAQIDRELRSELESRLDTALAAGLAREVESALAPVRHRLPEEELAVAGGRLRAQLLRRRLKLPLLSLFAPEARQPPSDAAGR
ncbi:MAG: hypothetical protein U0X73_03740 [Thermoanaerobaculia bacterium]